MESCQGRGKAEVNKPLRSTVSVLPERFLRWGAFLSPPSMCAVRRVSLIAPGNISTNFCFIAKLDKSQHRSGVNISFGFTKLHTYKLIRRCKQPSVKWSRTVFYLTVAEIEKF